MTTIKFRRDTSANWTSVNPIPAQGEPCYETDTGKLKIGNGSDNYVTLPYVSDGGGSSGDLPIATATTLGGIKVGDNLSITEDGKLSASSEAKTVKTPSGRIELDDAGLHNQNNSRTIITRNTDQQEVRVGNDYELTIIDGSSIKLNSTNITDRDGNTFLSGDTINGVKLSTDMYGNKSVANSEYTNNRLELTTNACNLYDSDNRQVFSSSYNSGIGKTDWKFASQSDTVRIANWSASNGYGLMLKAPTDGTSPTIGYTYYGTDSSLYGKEQTFLRTEDVDNSTIKIVNGKLTASGGGSAETTDYTQLENKPQINSIELTGNKTLDDLGIQAKGNYQPAGDYATTADIPTKTSELTNDSGFITSVPVASSTVSGTVKVGSRLSINNGILSADIQKIDVDSALSSTSTNPVQNKVINSALAGKQDKITSTNKLSADLLKDGTTNKTVTATEKQTWNNKQNAITDLTTIRTNAANGNNAATTIAGYGDIVTHDASEFQASGSYAAKIHTHTKADITDFPTIPTKTSQLTNDSGFLTEAPTNMVTTNTDQTIEGVKRFTSKIESNNITMGGTANVTLNGGALVINQSTTGDTYPSRIFRNSNCITVKNGIPNTITSSDFFAIVDRDNNKVLSVNSGTGVTFTNNNRESYKLLASHDLSNFIDTNYLEWNGETEKITIKKDAVAHLAMPSDTKVKLTLGASGATYTAPADGWFTMAISGIKMLECAGMAPNANSPFYGYTVSVNQPGNSKYLRSTIQVSKEQSIFIVYEGTVVDKPFQFVYTNGSKPTS